MDAGLLEDGAGGATGDDAGTGGGGLEQHAARAHLADDRVDDRGAGQRDLEEVLAGLLGALLDGEGHLLGLAVAEADPAGAVADHHERGEGEPPAALDDLGHAVDVDDPGLPQLRVPTARVGGLFTLVVPSELQSGFAGGVGHGGDPAVVEVPAAVEDDLGRRRRPWPARRRASPTLAAASLLPVAPSRGGRSRGRGRGERATGAVVDHLGADVLVRPEHGQAGPVGRALRPSCAPDGAGAGGPWPASACADAHVVLTSPSCRPCGGRARRGSGRPCPCRARACGSRGCWRRPGRPSPCRCR